MDGFWDPYLSLDAYHIGLAFDVICTTFETVPPAKRAGCAVKRRASTAAMGAAKRTNAKFVNGLRYVAQKRDERGLQNCALPEPIMLTLPFWASRFAASKVPERATDKSKALVFRCSLMSPLPAMLASLLRNDADAMLK